MGRGLKQVNPLDEELSARGGSAPAPIRRGLKGCRPGFERLLVESGDLVSYSEGQQACNLCYK
jgi:hypothetical protein